MALDGKKKKIAVAGVVSLLLVAMVVGVAVGVTSQKSRGSKTEEPAAISATTRAVKEICAPTDYKQSCEESLSKANTINPKELIKMAFQVAQDKIEEAIKNSKTIQDAAKDPETKGAFEVCKEVLEDAVDDVKRSVEKMGSFDSSKIKEYVDDVMTWLSGSVTYQETCLDAFENTTGDAGLKMKELLKSAGELSSNGLAIMSGSQKFLSALGFSSSRRLFTKGSDKAPSFVSKAAKKIMASTPNTMKVDVVVALDGSGKFKSINEAIKSAPPKNNATFVIHIKAGVYKEYVTIPKRVDNIVLIGDGPTKTKITGNKNFIDGTKTYQSCTLAVDGFNFIAKDLTIENSSGPEKHQAVAVRVSGDKAIFHNVRMDSYQDTLYAHTHRHLYRDCTITGTIDFIFGDALAIFQNCNLVVRKPLANQACMYTAQGRKESHSIGATIIQGSNFTAEPDFLATKPAIQAYLGRPWKIYSRTIIMQSEIGGFVSPDGYAPWDATQETESLYYGEYQNRGPGANLNRRVKWKGIRNITPQVAESFTLGNLFREDAWIKQAGVPFATGMM